MLKEVKKILKKAKKKELKFIPLYRDLTYKNLFGTNKNVKFTISLLDSLYNLDENIFECAKVINSVKLNKKTIKEKGFEMDIVVKLKNNNIINLEVQDINTVLTDRKNFMYAQVLICKSSKNGKRI